MADRLPSFVDRLQIPEIIIADGAKGTELMPFLHQLQQQPDYQGLPNITDVLNLHWPGVVQDVLHKYILAGARIIQTNTFNSNGAVLSRWGMSDQITALNQEGARIARDAAGSFAYVSGDIGQTGLGPYLAGAEKRGQRTRISGLKDQIHAAIVPQARGLLEQGNVDVIHIETQQYIGETHAIIDAVREVSRDIPLIVTMSFDTVSSAGLVTKGGVTPHDFVELTNKEGVHVRGANCGLGFEKIEELMRHLRGNDQKAILMAKVNMGLPEFDQGEMVYRGTPEEVREYVRLMQSQDVRLIGLCCGSKPKDIDIIRVALSSPMMNTQ